MKYDTTNFMKLCLMGITVQNYKLHWRVQTLNQWDENQTLTGVWETWIPKLLIECSELLFNGILLLSILIWLTHVKSATCSLF